MGELNEDQFGIKSHKAKAEAFASEFRPEYSGQHGEPNPAEYGHDWDWVQDHRRWDRAQKQGKKFVDTGLQQLKREAKKAEAPLVEQGKVENKKRSITMRHARIGMAAGKRLRRRFGK